MSIIQEPTYKEINRSQEMHQSLEKFGVEVGKNFLDPPNAAYMSMGSLTALADRVT